MVQQQVKEDHPHARHPHRDRCPRPLVIISPALAACPVDDAKVEKAIATKPELRDGAGVQVARDLRTLRDAAVVLDAYEHDSACRQIVAVLNTLAANSERALVAGDTDEGRAEQIERARKPKAARP